MPDEMVCAEVLVSGRVQGVGYRYFTERLASDIGVDGWSRNLGDGRVELEVEGARKNVEKFIEELGVGPRMARVSGVSVVYKPYRGVHKGFSIKY